MYQHETDIVKPASGCESHMKMAPKQQYFHFRLALSFVVAIA